MKYFLLIWTLLEISVFILIGQWLGVLVTLLLVILTGILGFVLLRDESVAVMRRVQVRLQEGKPPTFVDFNSSMTMLAGVLLLVPGFIGDAVGLVCLIPRIRQLFTNKPNPKKPHQPKEPHIIEGQCWHEKGEKPKDKHDDDTPH
jgi:UPF0716 protein FxsA